MASIFKKDDNFVDKPNRNSFDLSFQNNLSLKFGKLVPCFCQEVLPGDSFRIKPTFGLRFLPQVFPVQTRMRAHMHFFYVRNRTIWKDWMDFIGKTKSGLTPPYLVSPRDSVNPSADIADDSFHESSIYDYMGLPCTLDCDLDASAPYVLMSNNGKPAYVTFNGDDIVTNSTQKAYVKLTSQTLNTVSSVSANSQLASGNVYRCLYNQYQQPINFDEHENDYTFRITYSKTANVPSNLYLVAYASRSADNVFNKLIYVRVNIDPIVSINASTRTSIIDDNGNLRVYNIDKIIGYFIVNSSGEYGTSTNNDVQVSVQIIPKYNRGMSYTNLSVNTLPYGDGDWQYRINVLPFRAYEAVYNSFYRNPENNPFKINGVNEYNVYVKSLDGGAQPSTDFSLFNRNWEDDAFTTAVPTPQQGDAPRVGLTGSPGEPVELRYMSEDGEVEGLVTLRTDSYGHVTMIGQDNPGTEPNTLVNALNDAINFGITINDLRNVNALQLWLEKNVRKGYKYRDQLLSHYGVSISYNDLLMPEFIGGVSRDVTVNQVTQTVETNTGNLGDMAGQAYVVGDGNAVTKYCDEHGYIIGILSVVPVPNYSQLIPKYFFKHDTFDYFFPEFGKIGMQPITCKEIASTASWLTHKGEDTFGYQRAWYDYLANVDQVHGKFNSQFYDFLIQRKFGNVPELGADFTTVKNEDLNNVFYVDDGEDKILGQIYFDVKAIRPIPLFGIPSLE